MTDVFNAQNLFTSSLHTETCKGEVVVLCRTSLASVIYRFGGIPSMPGLGKSAADQVKTPDSKGAGLATAQLSVVWGL